MAGSAAAARFDIDTFDTIYGPYSGTVASAGSFTWMTAGYFWGGNIDLTEGGDVIADIVTNYNDTYTLYTDDAAVGAPCTASACIAVTNGETVSLYDTISGLNGGYGVCCDFNGVTPQITVNPVPEASTWAMMVLGVGAMGVALVGVARSRSSPFKSSTNSIASRGRSDRSGPFHNSTDQGTRAARTAPRRDRANRRSPVRGSLRRCGPDAADGPRG